MSPLPPGSAGMSGGSVEMKLTPSLSFFSQLQLQIRPEAKQHSEQRCKPTVNIHKNDIRKGRHAQFK